MDSKQISPKILKVAKKNLKYNRKLLKEDHGQRRFQNGGRGM